MVSTDSAGKDPGHSQGQESLILLRFHWNLPGGRMGEAAILVSSLGF